MKIFKSTKLLLILLLTFGGFIFAFLCIWVIFFSGIINVQKNSGDIRVIEAYITDKLDEKNPTPKRNIYKTDPKRIFCYVKIASPKPIRVGIKWYLGGNLLYEDSQTIEEDAFFYLEPLQNQRWQAGQYKVDIYILNQPIRSLEFEMKDP